MMPKRKKGHKRTWQQWSRGLASLDLLVGIADGFPRSLRSCYRADVTSVNGPSASSRDGHAWTPS